MDPLLYLIPLFFFTAITYSMVGFGGGSTYLALLVLFAFPYEAIPKTALICNLVVVGGGCYFFFKAGFFSLKKILPFIVTSIPCAYWGGRIPIQREVFIIILALSLAVAAMRMLFSHQEFKVRKNLTWKQAWVVGLPTGAILGLLSGLIGIGGGIFLLPILYILGWAHAKEAAAAASLFILVNSLAGLVGQFQKNPGLTEITTILPLAMAVLLGGQIGSRIGSGYISKVTLQRVAGFLILFVSVRLMWGLL